MLRGVSLLCLGVHDPKAGACSQQSNESRRGGRVAGAGGLSKGLALGGRSLASPSLVHCSVSKHTLLPLLASRSVLGCGLQ